MKLVSPLVRTLPVLLVDKERPLSQDSKTMSFSDTYDEYELCDGDVHIVAFSAYTYLLPPGVLQHEERVGQEEVDGIYHSRVAINVT